MRISDWSSDVCSSDLCILLQIGRQRMTFQHVRQRVVKRRRIFSEPGFVISSTKYQLHDRDHLRARLRLDACILQQFGIIVGAWLSNQSETVGQADRDIKRPEAADPPGRAAERRSGTVGVKK